MDDRNPIFIIGPSRCGTELLRSALNAHPLIWISRETHYFDDLRPRLRRPNKPIRLQDKPQVFAYFSNLQSQAYGLNPGCEAQSATGDVKDDRSDLSADDWFYRHCDSQLAAMGKSLWGEKTPRHVFRIREILDVFPNAKLVAMVRDPRAAVASYRDWQNRWFDKTKIEPELAMAVTKEEARARRSYSLAVVSLLWRSAVLTAQRLASQAPRSVKIVRFEDLVAAPEPTLRDLSAWLGIEYHGDMLQVGVVNSSYLDAGAQAGFAQSSSERWRETLSTDECAFVEWVAGATATQLGYQRSFPGVRFGFLLRQVFEFPIALTRAVGANRNRIARLGPYILTRAKGALTG